MKIKKQWAGVIFFLVLGQIAYAADDDSKAFDQFKAQRTQAVNETLAEFDDYKKELEAGFQAYTKAYKQATKDEEKRVKNVWGDYRPGDAKRWVQYDKSGVRQSVDFESGNIELEMLVDDKASTKKAEEALKNKILALLSTTRREAFKNDNVAQAVEKKVSNLPLAKTSTVPATPIMKGLVPEKMLSSKSQVKKISKKYAKSAKTDSRPAQRKGKKVVRVKFKIPVDVPAKSKAFIKQASKIAKKENVPLTLVMAVMETESAFNPMAKSGVPAYGLMQIVPRSAGQDATAYLFGKAKILSPSYLYNSDKNIEIGGAYLHILYFRYLKKVKDPVNRLYCAIAAYNTGAGNVAKAFIGTTNINKASAKINKLTPKQVYRKLRKDLPYKETRHYVKKVSKNLSKYQGVN